VATLERPGGVGLHLTERGEGPPVVLAPYWSGNPSVYEELLTDLAGDHRVLTWDARGTGGSTRRGPYDAETDCADLEAVLDLCGGPAAIIGVVNGTNHAVRVAARRPDLVGAVIAFGTGPLSREHLLGGEGLVASDAVVDAFLKMLESDYRGALRTLIASTNPQMSEDEVRRRVATQLEYCPQEAAVARVRAWAEDDPTEPARSIGDRLWVLSAPDVAGPWLPPRGERQRLTQTLTPDAHVEETRSGEGPISRPALTAATIRRITTSMLSASAPPPDAAEPGRRAPD
jgi:pimeloyl-ACP methyl ester carboxylesterase